MTHGIPQPHSLLSNQFHRIYVAYIFINIYTQTCKTSWRSTYDFKLMSSDNLGSQIC